QHDELTIKAVYNLSPEYLEKGPVRLSASEIDRVSLGEKGWEYVANMGSDPRVQYPEQARREGIVSMLSAGMSYKGQSVGVLRVYTDVEQRFSPYKIDLLRSVAAQAAAAIENTRRAEDAREAEEAHRHTPQPGPDQ